MSSWMQVITAGTILDFKQGIWALLYYIYAYTSTPGKVALLFMWNRMVHFPLSKKRQIIILILKATLMKM